MTSDIPESFTAVSSETDFVRREMLIPMRDGTRLFTLLVMRKDTTRAPILLERTPYGAEQIAIRSASPHISQALSAVDAAYVENGYIRIFQDVRGRNQSEGIYVLNRPLSGPLNQSGIDDATDAYDTIEWLVNHVPETNGRVGVLGGSYDGFTALMAVFSAHSALKAVLAINPMVDTWMGDDWYHHGAFRQITLGAIPALTARKSGMASLPTGYVDLYTHFLRTGSAGDYLRRYGIDEFAAAQRITTHTAYDSWWQGQALDKLLARTDIKTPILLVASQWDEQDLYGAPAMFRALHPTDAQRQVTLLLGPWAHMGVNGDGAHLGDVRFDQDTAAHARREFIEPFLAAHLKSDAPKFESSPITSYTTGGGGWWHATDFAKSETALYLHAGTRLSFDRPSAEERTADEYVSDPAKPVGVISKPFYSGSDAWKTSMIADQRFASQRTDVLTYMTAPLAQSIHIFGQSQVNLFAATTGTDSDFVVKLIDVYPEDFADHELAGYQLPVAMDIFRGRYVGGFDQPAPLAAGRVEEFRFALPVADHLFARGHRIMVQVQSSWFPVYDRNPQKYVPNIFDAKPADYIKVTERIYHDPSHPSRLALPVVPQ